MLTRNTSPVKAKQVEDDEIWENDKKWSFTALKNQNNFIITNGNYSMCPTVFLNDITFAIKQ